MAQYKNLKKIILRLETPKDLGKLLKNKEQEELFKKWPDFFKDMKELADKEGLRIAYKQARKLAQIGMERFLTTGK